MNDDELLRAVARAAKRDPDRARAPAWEKLASGAASAEERSALEARAREEEEPDAVRAMEPMGDALAARVAARLAADAAPKKTSRARRATLVAGALALAAGIALFATRATTTGEPLPMYAISVTGGVRETRGAPDPSAPIRLGETSRLAIALRPARDVTGPLDVRTAIVRGGVAQTWSPPVTVSPTGVVRIEGDAPSLIPGPNGPCDLVIALGAAGSAPADPAALAAAAPSDRLVVERIRVELLDRR